MPRYRKKAIIIDAWQNLPENLSVPNWVQESARGVVGDPLRVYTAEGVMTANPGDWLIRGIANEVYPCKPDIFAATYEAAD